MTTAPTIATPTGGVALTEDEMGPGVVPFHELMAGAPIGRATDVTVDVPVWRGLSFVRLLAWIVAARIAKPGTRVDWWAPKKALASVGRTLRADGWVLQGDEWLPPADPAPDAPPPASFVDGTVRIAADWGVFGSRRVDDGTRLLAATVPARGRVSDVGTGAGTLAVLLAARGLTTGAVLSDVDAVALHLARVNVPGSTLVWSGDPTSWPATDFTVCNFPTHLPRRASDALLQGLVERAGAEPVFIVVHRSLRDRFPGEVIAEETHSVLRLNPARPAGAGTRRG